MPQRESARNLPEHKALFLHLLCSSLSLPTDEDLVSWHGPLAAGLAFWLQTTFCNWAGECCLCSGCWCQLSPPSPPQPGLQMALPAPSSLSSDSPLLPPVLLKHLYSTPLSRCYSLANHSLAHPTNLPPSKPFPFGAGKQDVHHKQYYNKLQITGKKSGQEL